MMDEGSRLFQDFGPLNIVDLISENSLQLGLHVLVFAFFSNKTIDTVFVF